MTETVEQLYSKESEMLVLGCALVNNKALNATCKLLSEYDFFHERHSAIFRAIYSTWKSGEVSDVHLTVEELKKHGRLGSIGGPGYLTELAQYAGAGSYFDEYINNLKVYSKKRKVLGTLDKAKRDIENGKDFKTTIISTQEDLKSIERDKGTKDKFPIKFLSEFGENYLLVKPPSKPMLLEYTNEEKSLVGFLPKGIVAMIVGAGGVGKTHLLAQMAISVATGTPFLDKINPTKHCGQNNRGNVFLGFGENQDEDIHRLLYKATKGIRTQENSETLLRAASKNIAAFSFSGQQASFIEDGKPSIYFRELKMRLEDKAPDGGWSLIILDPVSRLMGADAETDNAAATQFIALLEELTIDLPGNPTVLFSHHTNKSAIGAGNKQDQTAARGSSALTDGVRWQSNFIKEVDKEFNPTGISTLQMTKSNFTAVFEKIDTKKDDEGFIKESDKQLFSEKAKSTDNKKKQVPNGALKYATQGIFGMDNG